MVFVYRDLSQSNLQEVYDDLCGVQEVVEELGITDWRMRRWIIRRDQTRCPLPVRELSSIKVYSMVEWQAWFKGWTATRGLDGQRGPKRKPSSYDPPAPVFNSGNWR